MQGLVAIKGERRDLTIEEQIIFAKGQFAAISDLYEFYNKSKYNTYLRTMMIFYSDKIKDLQAKQKTES